MKTCFKCGVTKRLGEFYKHSIMADGHLNKCIDCTKVDVRNHRNKNIEKVRAYDRFRYENSEDRKRSARECLKRAREDGRQKEYSRRARERYPEKYRARTAASNAIRDGKLKKLPCEICGSTKVQAHHEDYSKPLHVMWLCHKHHTELHKLKV